MRGLHELRVKESDRLAAVADGLKANRIDCGSTATIFSCKGAGAPGRQAGRHPARPSHRHEFPRHGSCFGKDVTVDDETMIATSFPTFKALMASLGAQLPDHRHRRTGGLRQGTIALKAGEAFRPAASRHVAFYRATALALTGRGKVRLSGTRGGGGGLALTDFR